MDYICTNIDKFAAKNLIKGRNNNFFNFKELILSKSYIPLCDSLLNHILSCNNLPNLDKLLYLTAYSLSFINLNKTGHRFAALSAKKIAETVGCSKSQVLAIQKNLSKKDYLTITREKNKYGQNNRNLLAPVLPSQVFAKLCLALDKKGIYLPFNEQEETPLSYLERSKQYIPLNYQIFKLVASSSKLTSRQKILWLISYARAYKNSLVVGDKSNDHLSFTSSYLELASRIGCSSKILSADLNVLAKEGYLQKQRFYIKNGSDLQDRCDKSLWSFTLSMPAQYQEEINNIEDRKGYVKKAVEPYNKRHEQECNKQSTLISDPDYPEFRPQLNKEFKINKDRSREANFEIFKKEERKKEQININTETKEAVSQKSTENKFESSLNQNAALLISVKPTKKSYNLKRKLISEVEPISEKEADILRNSSDRDFSCAYMNKLVQKLSKQFPEHGFYTRKLFLSYMSKTLVSELRETTIVNNTDFNFKAEEQVRNQEKYLEQVETSYDISMEAQLKKKIAGRFESSLAYQILTSCEFEGPSTDQELQSQTFVINMSKQFSLAESQEDMLLEQVRAVYGNKITKLEFKQATRFILTDKENGNRNKGENNRYLNIQKDEQTLIHETLAQAIPGTIWHKVSKNLIIKHGIYLYKAWFGADKMQAFADEQNKTLSLKTASDFFASYIQSNYLQDITLICRQENYTLSKIWAS